MLPPDIDPQSRCRLPRVRREDLDPARQERYDTAVNPKGGTIRGLAGPAGIHLHSKKLSIVGDPLGKYLRFEADHTPRQREVAILISARMSDSRFEWAAHEPQALKDGVPQQTIEAIKHKKTARRARRQRRHHHPARPRDFRRPPGQAADLPEGAGRIRPRRPRRPGGADGQLRFHRRPAVLFRHAARRRHDSAAASGLGLDQRAFRWNHRNAQKLIDF